jgi:DnaJ-domain-containing protein 1
MSIFGRVGALLRSELGARVRRRPTVHRTPGRTVRDDARSHGDPATAERRGAPAPDPELTRYYANLELPYGAPIDAVREARRRLLKRYHPDLHSADPEKRRTATQLAQGLNRAHDELVSQLDRKLR